MLLLLIVFGPFAAALISYLIGRKTEGLFWAAFRMIFTAAECLLVLALFLSWRSAPDRIPAIRLTGIFAGELGFYADGFRIVYAAITAWMWALTTFFSEEYFDEEREHLNRYWFFVLLTLGATEGVMLSADLMTAFFFFEILLFTSFTWVIHEETHDAVQAGYTYLFIAVIGGLVLFMGLALVWRCCGTLRFDELAQAAKSTAQPGVLRTGAVCILLGFGAKAGMVPVHVWLPKAHPVAPSPSSALLSGILTKVGIYGILMTSLHVMEGDKIFGCIVLCAGVVTMLLGAVLALFSVNLKRTLACSSMSQIGFILTGTGMMILLGHAGEEEGVLLACSGLMMHMVNHSLIKLTLFMCAGEVVMRAHTLLLDDIRGFGRSRNVLKVSFALGALGISGVPLFNGYISKCMLHESIVEGIHYCAGMHGILQAVEWIFLFSGGLTFGYMLKLFICIFIQKNKDPLRQEKYDLKDRWHHKASVWPIPVSAVFCFLLGQPFLALGTARMMTGEALPFHAFSQENLKGGMISLTIGALVYLFVVRRWMMREGSYINRWPQELDLEVRVYRPLITKILPGAMGAVLRLPGENVITGKLAKAVLKVHMAVMHVFEMDLYRENVVTGTLIRAVLFVLLVLLRALEMSLDGIAVLLRRTILKEKRGKTGKEGDMWLGRIIAAELTQASRPLVSNFTFALMMTCIGIVVILCVLVYTAVL